MNRYCYRIRFRDRIGMARDVAEVAAGLGANITSMQVKPGVMHLQIGYVPDAVLSIFLRQLKAQQDVLEVEQVEWLPHELSRQRFNAIFDTVEEGILVIDKQGVINMCNQKAIEMLEPGSSLVGKSLQDVSFTQNILKSLTTSELNRKEVLLNTPRGSVRFLVKNRSILDDRGNIDGSMITIEQMSKVRRLANSLIQPVMITFDEIVHVSAKMSKVVSLAKAVAKGNSTILICGESGTGKELFARAVHMASSRIENPFVVINCAAIPDALLESELFGYAEGTFTGGRKGGRQGLFEFAHSGTIFLDEVAEMPPYIQAKLLRVLQSGCVRRLGEMLENEVDVRVIAATNRNLEEMIAAGSFREDLYYRLNVIPLHLPSLREHKEDIPVLTQHFVNKYNERLGKRIETISQEVLELFLSYDWPGNVRELENIIERAVNLAQEEQLQAAHIQLPELVKVDKIHNDLKRTVKEIEKRALLEALKECRSIRKAAKLLGVSHATVINKMRRYNIK